MKNNSSVTKLTLSAVFLALGIVLPLSLIHIFNNLEWPTKDFCGTHLEQGQEIYYNPEEPKKLYVKYDSGFALFEAEETTETDANDN